VGKKKKLEVKSKEASKEKAVKKQAAKKKTAKKKAVKKKTVKKKTVKENREQKSTPVAVAEPVKINKEKRLEMIRTAAYHLAEQRGFHPGLEMDDWLLAEQDIEEVFILDDD
jgi:hypothetical protein